MEYKESQLLETIADSSQGVCFDGTYYYVTDNDNIYKYNTSGSKIAQRNCTSDGTNHHLGDLTIQNGILYIMSSAYPSTPLNGYVKEYNASDLSYRSVEHFLGSTYLAESLDWDGTYWWTVSDGNLIQRWDSNFANPTTFTPNMLPTTRTNSHGWQGIKWHNGYLYLNVHEGSVPTAFHRFAFDGTNLTIDAYYSRPKWCSQGFDIDGDEVIFAKRAYGSTTGISDAIVRTKLVPEDYRQRNVIIGEDFNERTTTSTSYVEQTNLKLSIIAKKDDIVKVTLQGLFRVDGGSLRAYIDLASTNTTPVKELSSPTSIRTQVTNSECVSLNQDRYFAAQADGKLIFDTYFKQTSGSSSVRMKDRTMIAQVIGKDTD